MTYTDTSILTLLIQRGKNTFGARKNSVQDPTHFKHFTRSHGEFILIIQC